MRETRLIMGMPITVEVVDHISSSDLEKVFKYFRNVDEKFSTYKDSSEIQQINRGRLAEDFYSDEMKEVLRLCEQTKQQTQGFFDIRTPNGDLDPSGLVKGWAIFHAAQILKSNGFQNFYIDAGGDIQPSGHNSEGRPWRIGIKNPLNEKEIIKIVYTKNEGVATSGTYIRGQHIYNPHTKDRPSKIISLTVIGPNIYEADRFATAAFAMGAAGINFIENLPGFEGFMVDEQGMGIKTSGFSSYTKED